jgi:hypothetical protein
VIRLKVKRETKRRITRDAGKSLACLRTDFAGGCA